MFNEFHWNLYKSSPDGAALINEYRTQDLAKVLPETSLDTLVAYETGIKEALCLKASLDSPFKFLLERGFKISSGEDSLIINGKNFSYHEDLTVVSSTLYCLYPEVYLPYFFIDCIDVLYKIMDYLDLDVPDFPPKKGKLDRWLYYDSLCKVLHRYRLSINLSPGEYTAFLYGFVVQTLDIDRESKELPKPSNIWIVGGNKKGGDFKKLDAADREFSTYWQGNQYAKAGDIVVMYCLSPRSYIHSIWQTITDGYIDPFFHYYSQVQIKFKHRVPKVSISDLKNDTYFKVHPLVRKNLQGLNGYKLSSIDYDNLYRMFSSKAGPFAKELTVWSPTFQLNENLKIEREVELTLIEPFIESLGYSKNDWARQYELSMGVGSSKYPDYVFPDVTSKESDKMKFILEAKYEVSNYNSYSKAFDQARSYGLRLNCERIVIADKNSIWIHERSNGSFFRDNYIKYYWNQLDDADVFSKVKSVIGK